MTRIVAAAALVLAAVTAPVTATAAAPPVASPGLVLPTGETVQVTSPASHAHVVQKPGAHVLVVRLGARTLLLPREALPLLGRLDLDLFDAAQLAAHAGKLPVVITGSAASVPGVTITSRAGSTAHGYVTPASAARLGAAMRAGLAGVQRLALDAPAAVRPAFPQVTLDVKVASPAGVTPDATLLLVVNVDDARKANLGVGLAGDDQRVSLPKGHYTLIALTFTGDKQDGVVSRYGFTAGVTVSTDDQTALVDTRTATQDAFPTFVTPRPTTLSWRDLAYNVTDDRGQFATGIDNPDDGTGVILTGPARGGAHGLLSSVAYAGFVARDSSHYYLAAGHRNAVVPGGRVAPTAAELAAIRVYSYTDGRTLDSYGGRSAAFPYFDPGGFFGDDLPDSAVRTDYVGTGGGLEWISDNNQASRDGSAVRSVVGLARAYPAGVTTREDLFRGPLAPGVHSQPGFGRSDCQACRSGSQLLLGVANITDTDPTHIGQLYAVDPPELRVTVRRDGEQVFASDEVVYALNTAVIDVPPGDHGYDVVADHDGTVVGQLQSTHSRTEWRFRSSETSGAAAPASWTCGAAGTDGCTVLPVLTVRDPLPTTVRGALPAGTTNVVVSVTPVDGARGTRAVGLAYGLAVDGRGYVPQRVQALGAGRFLVTLVTPHVAPGTGMSVHLHAIDAAGGSIDQTVQTAYTVAGS